MDKLIFQKLPNVEIGSNTFIDCPTILQFDESPLIEVVRVQDAGFATQIPIYHEDGTYLAKVVGSQIHKTEAGNKAGLVMLHPEGMTVCKMRGQVIFEIRRKDAASLRTAAELYTPKGYFVKYSGDKPTLIDTTGGELKVGGLIMKGSTIMGCRIGVWLKSDGSFSLGCN